MSFSGETSAFLSNRGGGGGGGTKTACEDFFHSLFALPNVDTLIYRTIFGPLAMKSQGFVACFNPISST